MPQIINGQTVLDEDYDEEFEPTEEELNEYAVEIGVDPGVEPHLMPLVLQAIKAPLPQGWKPCADEKGEVYYFNFETGDSTWQHPNDDQYKSLVDEARQKAVAMIQQEGAAGKKKGKKGGKGKKEKKGATAPLAAKQGLAPLKAAGSPGNSLTSSLAPLRSSGGGSQMGGGSLLAPLSAGSPSPLSAPGVGGMGSMVMSPTSSPGGGWMGSAGALRGSGGGLGPVGPLAAPVGLGGPPMGSLGHPSSGMGGAPSGMISKAMASMDRSDHMGGGIGPPVGGPGHMGGGMGAPVGSLGSPTRAGPPGGFLKYGSQPTAPKGTDINTMSFLKKEENVNMFSSDYEDDYGVTNTSSVPIVLGKSYDSDSTMTRPMQSLTGGLILDASLLEAADTEELKVVDSFDSYQPTPRKPRTRLGSSGHLSTVGGGATTEDTETETESRTPTPASRFFGGKNKGGNTAADGTGDKPEEDKPTADSFQGDSFHGASFLSHNLMLSMSDEDEDKEAEQSPPPVTAGSRFLKKPPQTAPEDDLEAKGRAALQAAEAAERRASEAAERRRLQQEQEDREEEEEEEEKRKREEAVRTSETEDSSTEEDEENEDENEEEKGEELGSIEMMKSLEMMKSVTKEKEDERMISRNRMSLDNLRDRLEEELRDAKIDLHEEKESRMKTMREELAAEQSREEELLRAQAKYSLEKLKEEEEKVGEKERESLRERLQQQLEDIEREEREKVESKLSELRRGLEDKEGVLANEKTQLRQEMEKELEKVREEEKRRLDSNHQRLLEEIKLKAKAHLEEMSQRAREESERAQASKRRELESDSALALKGLEEEVKALQKERRDELEAEKEKEERRERTIARVDQTVESGLKEVQLKHQLSTQKEMEEMRMTQEEELRTFRQELASRAESDREQARQEERAETDRVKRETRAALSQARVDSRAEVERVRQEGREDIERIKEEMAGEREDMKKLKEEVEADEEDLKERRKELDTENGRFAKEHMAFLEESEKALPLADLVARLKAEENKAQQRLVKTRADLDELKEERKRCDEEIVAMETKREALKADLHDLKNAAQLSKQAAPSEQGQGQGLRLEDLNSSSPTPRTPRIENNRSVGDHTVTRGSASENGRQRANDQMDSDQVGDGGDRRRRAFSPSDRLVDSFSHQGQGQARNRGHHSREFSLSSSGSKEEGGGNSDGSFQQSTGHHRANGSPMTNGKPRSLRWGAAVSGGRSRSRWPNRPASAGDKKSYSDYDEPQSLGKAKRKSPAYGRPSERVSRWLDSDEDVNQDEESCRKGTRKRNRRAFPVSLDVDALLESSSDEGTGGYYSYIHSGKMAAPGSRSRLLRRALGEDHPALAAAGGTAAIATNQTDRRRKQRQEVEEALAFSRRLMRRYERSKPGFYGPREGVSDGGPLSDAEASDHEGFFDWVDDNLKTLNVGSVATAAQTNSTGPSSTFVNGNGATAEGGVPINGLSVHTGPERTHTAATNGQTNGWYNGGDMYSPGLVSPAARSAAGLPVSRRSEWASRVSESGSGSIEDYLAARFRHLMPPSWREPGGTGRKVGLDIPWQSAHDLVRERIRKGRLGSPSPSTPAASSFIPPGHATSSADIADRIARQRRWIKDFESKRSSLMGGPLSPPVIGGSGVSGGFSHGKLGNGFTNNIGPLVSSANGEHGRSPAPQLYFDESNRLRVKS